MPPLDELIQEPERLRIENDLLRNLLQANGIALPDATPDVRMPPEIRQETTTEKTALAVAPATKTSPLSEKTALFLSLFQGRADVYARRWESKKLAFGLQSYVQQ